MKNWLTAGTGQTFRRWSLQIIGWGLGIPAGWWIVSTSYRLQQSWTDSRFVAIYLFCMSQLRCWRSEPGHVILICRVSRCGDCASSQAWAWDVYSGRWCSRNTAPG